ncbi:hypothetical protein DPMN_129174 [Dreissena polymorpha]|uniref:Uncharacterized protein n=1 Tax=Dreissena polymorpha TaxID=45954 RepID=A0A9D4H0Q9_DREPO|nr:hypothetical protein DPMN_129174 [Dreissena polymorpha]
MICVRVRKELRGHTCMGDSEKVKIICARERKEWDIPVCERVREGLEAPPLLSHYQPCLFLPNQKLSFRVHLPSSSHEKHTNHYRLAYCE